MTAGAALPAALFATLASLQTAAHAAPQIFVALEYEVASDAGRCPAAEEFRASVEHQLGYDPFRPDTDRRVVVQIARKDAGFDGRIRWSDAQGQSGGERRLASRRAECNEIAANLAFSVAVQIQLLAALAPSAPIPPPAPRGAEGANGIAGAAGTSVAPAGIAVAADTRATSAERPAGAAAPLSPERQRAEPVRRLKLSVGLGPSLALGLAPHPTGLGRIFVNGRVARVSLELAVDGALPVEQDAGNGSGFSLERFAATAAACGHARVFAACLTATLGRIEARGFGVDVPRSPAGFFSQLGARLAAARDLGDRYFVAARLEALVMLSSWTVTLDDVAAWTTPRVGALIGLDLGARFF